jgi:hypothetical protein
MHTMKVAVVFLVISGATAVAQQMPMPMNAGDLKWDPAPNARSADCRCIGRSVQGRTVCRATETASELRATGAQPPDLRIRDCHNGRFPHRDGGQTGSEEWFGVTGRRFCRGIS